MMNNVEQHQMQQVKTYPSGAEEWRCPTCERRFVLHWRPYKRIVLNAGDEHAIHAGSKGGVQMGSAHLDFAEERNGNEPDEQILSDELRDAIEEFFKDVDFDD